MSNDPTRDETTELVPVGPSPRLGPASLTMGTLCLDTRGVGRRWPSDGYECVQMISVGADEHEDGTMLGSVAIESPMVLLAGEEARKVAGYPSRLPTCRTGSATAASGAP